MPSTPHSLSSNKGSREGSQHNLNRMHPWSSEMMYPGGLHCDIAGFNPNRRKSTGEVSFRSDKCMYNGSATCTPNGSDICPGMNPIGWG